MIKKKVKKIPKYSIGSSGITPGGYDPNMFNKSTLYKPSILNSDAVQSFNLATNAVNTTLSLDNPTLYNQLLFNQQMNQGLNNPTKNTQNYLRGMLGSTASGAGLGFMVGDPMGAGIGAAAGLLVDTLPKIIGTGGSVDQNTGEIQYASGLGKIFGRSDAALRRESNRVKNVNLSRVQTENLKTDYYNNPNVPTSVNVLAAEGGIVPGEHYASRGEVEVAADGTNAVRYGWDPEGKDTYHIYTNPDGSSAAGNMIFTEEGVKRPNGEKYSDSAEKIIKGTKEGSKLRQISLRKLANEMEEQKMNKELEKIKKGVPAYEGGKSGKEELDAEIAARKMAKRSTNDYFIYRKKDGTFVMQDIDGKQYEIPETMLSYIQGDESGYYFGPQTGVAPSAGKWNGSMNFAKQMLNSKNIQKLKNTATKVFGRNIKPANVSGPVKPVTGTSPAIPGTQKTAQEAAQIARNERTANMWRNLTTKSGVPQKTLEGPQTWTTSRAGSNLWENPMAMLSGDDIASAINTAYYLNKGLPTALGVATMLGGASTFLAYEATKDKQASTSNVTAAIPTDSDTPATKTTAETPTSVTEVPVASEKKKETTAAATSKKGTVAKPGSKKVTSRVTTSTTPSPEDTVVRRPVYEEPVKQAAATAPADDKKVYGRDGSVRYDYNAPERKVTPVDPGRSTSSDVKYTGSNWRDNLYRMAVLSQPLWDRAEAEPVNYESPVYKYMPTAIDITSQLRDADQSYALARYNFANLYPSTGAGMAAGLQAASNRAKQLADIRQYQTNAQNELIGKNAGIYNNWANKHARIMNDVYNKTAANRAAARNINRQNRAAALTNYGAMLSDDKKMAMERLKFAALKPAIKSTYEDASANDIYKWYKELFG